MTMTWQEQWRPIRNWEGIYEVSDAGRVKSLSRIIKIPDGTSRRLSERMLKLGIQIRGYAQVQLYRDNKCTPALVHRLVLDAFVGSSPDGAEACHDDGNKTNNRVSNLRWDNHQSNINDAIAAGTHVGARTACPSGHPFDEVNTLVTKAGKRQCRECGRIRGRAYSARIRAGLAPEPIICQECGVSSPRKSSGGPSKWCSDKCRKASANRRMRAQIHAE